MVNTPFSKKCDILGDLYSAGQTNEEVVSSDLWNDWADTLWICLAAKVGYVTINDSFHFFVESAWDAFCDYLGIDMYGDYPSLSYMVEFANGE